MGRENIQRERGGGGGGGQRDRWIDRGGARDRQSDRNMRTGKGIARVKLTETLKRQESEAIG